LNVALLSCVAAAAAGLAALLLELAWLRGASVALPGLLPAATLVLPAFLAAWAAGSMLGGRFVDSSSQRGLSAARWLALGALAVWLAPWLLERQAADVPPAGLWPRLARGALPALPAAFALGGALPLLARLRSAAGLPAARATGGVAASVALGGAAGCALYPELLLEGWAVGLVSALALAGSALICWLGALMGAEAGPGHGPVATPGEAPPEAPVALPRAPSLLPLAAFLAGTLLVAGQVLLLRVGAQLTGASMQTSVRVLLWLHLGMAAGAVLMIPAWRALPAEALTALLLAAAGLGLAWPAGWEGLLAAQLDPAPAALLLGLGAGSVVTAASRAARRPRARLGSWVGDLSGLSTLGGALGGLLVAQGLAGGAWGTPDLLRAGSLTAGGLALALAALGLWVAPRRVVASASALLVLAAAALGLTTSELSYPWRSAPDEQQLLGRHEGTHGLTDLVAVQGGSERLKLDGRFSLGGGGADVLARRLGRLAACLAPDAERALVLGMGAGHTLAGVRATTRARVDCVEHNRSIWQVGLAERAEGSEPVPGAPPPRAPALPVQPADARLWVAQHPLTYDLVVGDLFFPWLSGAGDLLSLEHLRSVRRCLTKRGVFVQWLPLHQLPWQAFGSAAASFVQVFPSARLLVATPLSNEPLVALVGGLPQGLPGQDALNELLAPAPDSAGPLQWTGLVDAHVCDAWRLTERFDSRPRVTLARPVTEIMSQGRADDEALLAHRNMRLLAELVQPLTTSSLARRPLDSRDNRELGRELQRRGVVLRLLLMARAATLERATVDRADPNQRPRLSDLDADIDHALLAAWSELPGHVATRLALLERSTELTGEQRWEDAATLLHGALERGRDVPLAAMLGGIFTRLGFLDEALELLRGARASGAAADRSLLLNLGAALLFAQAGDEQAREALEQALRLGPLPPLHRAALGLLQGQPGAAAAGRAYADALGEGEAWGVVLRRLSAASEG